MVVQEFLSENKHRSYPFEDGCDLGGMPDWVLLDLVVVDTEQFLDCSLRCTKTEFDGTLFRLRFEYTRSGSSPLLFTITAERGSDIVLSTSRVTEGVSVKYAVYGGGNEYDMPENFSSEVSAGVIATRIIALDRNMFVRSINGCSGSIHFVDGYNTRAITVDGRIIVTAGAGLGKGAYCDQPDDAFDCTKALLFINGQHADTSGNINISGGPGVIVQTGMNAFVGGSVIPAISIKADPRVKGLY